MSNRDTFLATLKRGPEAVRRFILTIDETRPLAALVMANGWANMPAVTHSEAAIGLRTNLLLKLAAGSPVAAFAAAALAVMGAGHESVSETVAAVDFSQLARRLSTDSERQAQHAAAMAETLLAQNNRLSAEGSPGLSKALKALQAALPPPPDEVGLTRQVTGSAFLAARAAKKDEEASVARWHGDLAQLKQVSCEIARGMAGASQVIAAFNGREKGRLYTLAKIEDGKLAAISNIASSLPSHFQTGINLQRYNNN